MSSTDTPLASFEDVVGRYVNLRSSGRDQRIYFEEAGSGPVLLCLHTAGADSRQFRHLLNDPEITSRFRVVAFDLPWHGHDAITGMDAAPSASRFRLIVLIAQPCPKQPAYGASAWR